MTSTSPTSSNELRHDLLNAVNVLLGATTALDATPLTEVQRTFVRMLSVTTDRLMAIANSVEKYQHNQWSEGQARLADLCSIAAARVGKPFDRAQLLHALEQVAGERGRRILLVDDSPYLVLLVRTYLEGTSWSVEVAEDGEQAVSRAQSEPYDVILMDIDLPGLDGATAAHAIRAGDLARGASPTPIIAMTAFDPPSRG